VKEVKHVPYGSELGGKKICLVGSEVPTEVGINRTIFSDFTSFSPVEVH
jgi:hypothetical protein